MTNETLSSAIREADQTRDVVVGRGALAEAGERIAAQLGSGPYLIVADQNTWEVAGKSVSDSLTAAGCTLRDELVFPGSPRLYASYDNAVIIKQAMGDAIPIAVGAGTINDLVKLAAFEMEREYAAVGTAASMDGYTGAGAPITENGVKATRACRAPAVAVMDLDVLAAAPKHMTASGYGDLSAKIPGGADWILADVTGVEPIQTTAWQIVQTGVATALANPAELAAGVPEAFQGLAEGLCLSGLAMQAYGGTRPASGAEHYFAHLWELEGIGQDLEPPASHGDKVAIGSIAMCAFYEALLSYDITSIDLDAAVAARQSWEEIETDIRRLFSGPLADHACRETKIKYASGTQLRQRLAPLVDNWPEVTARVSEQLISSRQLTEQLSAAGAPSKPSDIGLSFADVKAMFPLARYYRSRYTALDVAWELGIVDELTDEVFERIWS